MRKKNSHTFLAILVIAILTTIGYAELKDFLSVNGNVTLRKVDYKCEKTFNFNYTGSEQVFIAPASGYYQLETWGAQGGSYDENSQGGYGGYSKGIIYLNKKQKVYINVGGTTISTSGGYNGGGMGYYPNETIVDPMEYPEQEYFGGGGATHIALSSGLLAELENKKSDILIVSGAGGGVYHFNKKYSQSGGNGGGYVGNDGIDYRSECFPYDYSESPAKGGTQTGGGLGSGNKNEFIGTFGKGGNGKINDNTGGSAGGGAGYYGGGGTENIGCSAETGAGGSGYIGNEQLLDKVMYCYECEESSDYSTKTISTTNVSEEPISEYAKKGNGSAKITYIPTKSDKESEFDYTGSEQIFITPESGYYMLETWGAGNEVYIEENDDENFEPQTGGYSRGIVKLDKGEKLYVNVGGTGTWIDADANAKAFTPGGYNGGGSCISQCETGSGATHIAKTSGLLSSLENNKNDILIVSGGAAGRDNPGEDRYQQSYASGGGYYGGEGYLILNGENVNYSYGGDQEGYTWFGYVKGTTQNRDGTFGQGGTGCKSNYYNCGGAGGGGFIGGTGAATELSPGGGGSGYIANQLLTAKEMYCNNCEESNEYSIKTINTINKSVEAISYYPKLGNGYAKITYFNQKEITLVSSRPNTAVTLGDVCNVKKTNEDTTDNNYAGVFISSHNFIKGKDYIVEYDVQKKSGTLIAIGGHLYSNDNKEFFYLDGVLQNYNYNSFADNEDVSQSIDDNNIHHVKVIYKYTGIHYIDNKAEGLSINLQPNRGVNIPVEVDIFNIKVYESN